MAAVGCPGCSRELQFSEQQGCLVQLFFWAVSLIVLYLMDYRGWQLAVFSVVGGVVLTVVLIGPLGRILPQKLEPYESPPWRQPKAPKDGSILGLTSPEESTRLASSDQNEQPSDVE